MKQNLQGIFNKITLHRRNMTRMSLMCKIKRNAWEIMTGRSEIFDVIIRPTAEGAGRTTPEQIGHYSHNNRKLINSRSFHENSASLNRRGGHLVLWNPVSIVTPLYLNKCNRTDCTESGALTDMLDVMKVPPSVQYVCRTRVLGTSLSKSYQNLMTTVYQSRL